MPRDPATPNSDPGANDFPHGNLAYGWIIDALRDGQLRPGDRLREVDIAKQFDLSRTPVREALRRLEAEGMVEHRPRAGAVIRILGQAEVVELYEMRLVLERSAAELAARHAVPAETDELEALNAELAQATGAPARASALNKDFHRCLYRATRNRFLLEAARGLTNALLLLGPTLLDDDTRLGAVCDQHAEIIAALRARDPKAAAEAAEAHLQASLRFRLKALRQ